MSTTAEVRGYHVFIGDESQVRLFHKLHIMPFVLEPYLDFIIIPIARRKYWQELSKSQMNLNTKIFASDDDEDRFVNELRRYEVRCDLYKDVDKDIPSSAVAIYLTANPMNELKAFFAMQREVSEKLETIVLGRLRASSTTEGNGKGISNRIGQMTSIFKSCLHKSDQNVFLKLDVDTKEEQKIMTLKTFFKERQILPHLIVESRGGYHVLLKRSLLGKNHEHLHKFVEGATFHDPETKEEKSWVTVEKNALVIIPGTYQGGFLARIVNW